MKKVLIINGHPDPESFNQALSLAYEEGLRSTTAEVSRIDISNLDFNVNLKYGYRRKTTLEPDLLEALSKIKNASHIVWFFPMWWYGYPALMKGFIERVFLPGITFKYVEGSAFPKKLLQGKTARIVITADTPRWYDWLVMHSPALRQFKKGTLQFCGINPVKVTYIAPIRNASEAFRLKWLDKVKRLGTKAA